LEEENLQELANQGLRGLDVYPNPVCADDLQLIVYCH